MRQLIAVESCERDIPLNDASRETWAAPGSPPFDVDIRFFYGMTADVAEAVYDYEISPEIGDSVYLNVPDDYLSLSLKTRAICWWAIEHGYDMLHIVDSDAYVRPELLTATADYTGILARETKYGPYLWGAFYSLSKQAMALVAQTHPMPSPYEDVCTGIIMQNAGIKPTVDPSRFLLTKVVGHNDRNWDILHGQPWSAVAELNAKEIRMLYKHIENGTVEKIPFGPRHLHGSLRVRKP
jgi:hypothetical protein